MRIELVLDEAVRPVYMHLEPIVDLLLKSGNKLAIEYRWGENRTGFFCHLEKPIDFALVESAFVLPVFVRLHPEAGSIECDVTWATIRGGMAR